MLVAAGDGEQCFTDEEVLANVFTLLLAGEDTTANTLAWVVYFLALHQDVQRELRAEVDATLGSNATLTNHAHVADLPLLTAVVHETLRLKGPAPFVALSAARDVTLGGIAVPARTPVFVLLRALAVSAPGLREPNRFDPNRWRSANSGAAAELARSSLPFGAGPRICPGRQLALLECALAISALVRHFEVSLATQDEVRECFDFAMEPENLRVQLRAR